MYRLPPRDGEWIDRSRELALQFEGRAIRAYPGDTLTSALAANGVGVTARSFKYHRPRGPYSAAGHDANNLFQVGPEPNQRGDHLLARDGQRVTAVNTFGGVARDRAQVISRLARFLPVGFYYKAFRGRVSFPLFERLIRALSGLGRVALTQRPARRRRVHEFCDVAVVGSGLAGLSAALEAVRGGAGRVVVVEESQHAGGSALWQRASEPQTGAQADALLAEVAAEPRIRVLCAACAVGLYADNELAISRVDEADGGLTLLRARAVILATGAIEQPAVFRNNDLPGVLLGSGAQRLLYRYGVAAGAELVVLAGNRCGVAAALDLATQGLKVTTLAVLADSPVEATLLEDPRLAQAGIRVLRDVRPVEALSGAGGVLRALRIAAGQGEQELPCDTLLLSAGWMPALQLALQAGATVRFDETLQQHLPDTLPAGLYVAGRANGLHEPRAKALDGRRAGANAAAWLAGKAPGQPLPAAATHAHSHPMAIYPHPAGKEFVDLDEDLTLADLRNAAQEGFDSIELLKRYSTVGMGPSQGKLSNLNAARLLGSITGQPLHRVGLTTARPPYQPVTLGSLAGAGFSPLRRTPLDARHAALGAVWMPAGSWRRPAYYAVPGRSCAECVAAEVAAVRTAAGLIDVSTLGKIEVLGEQAALLLERLYTGRFADMLVGTTRYALMVDEAGTVIDDGVVARLAPTHFYVSTTTSASASVYREMQRRVAEWQLNCILHNLTGHMAAMNLAGPASRQILARCTGLDLSADGFAYLAAREAAVAGVNARLLRVGFVGELGYEIHVPASQADRVWQALREAGADAGLALFGVEAQRQLRLEKGHVIVSQDTDGVTSPYEAGMPWAVKLDKPFFVGQRSLKILKAKGPRQQLAGIELEQPDARVSECHLVIDGGEIAGRVTSIGRSASLGRTVGLAMLQPRLCVRGTRLIIRGEDGQSYAARVVPVPFYDPGQERQRSPEAAA